MTSELKAIVLLGALAAGGCTICVCNKHIQNRKIAEIELAKIKEETNFPPEYWQAKEAEAKANAETQQKEIESKERLKIDERTRFDARKNAEREFEKNAPAEYWEQKRIEAEEATKRASNEARYKAERDMAKYHNDSIEKVTKAVARAAGSNISPCTTALL